MFLFFKYEACGSPFNPVSAVEILMRNPDTIKAGVLRLFFG